MVSAKLGGVEMPQASYNISISDIIKAQQAGQHITVIINGEYYDLSESPYIENPRQCFRDNGVDFNEIIAIMR